MYRRYGSKYNAKKTVVDGIKFDSKKEADYYLKLKEMENKGEILTFERQVSYELLPSFKFNGRTIRGIKYIADFRVWYPNGYQEVVDVKGYITPEYRLKKKLLLYNNPDINFKEVH